MLKDVEETPMLQNKMLPAGPEAVGQGRGCCRGSAAPRCGIRHPSRACTGWGAPGRSDGPAREAEKPALARRAGEKGIEGSDQGTTQDGSPTGGQRTPFASTRSPGKRGESGTGPRDSVGVVASAGQPGGLLMEQATRRGRSAGLCSRFQPGRKWPCGPNSTRGGSSGNGCCAEVPAASSGRITVESWGPDHFRKQTSRHSKSPSWTVSGPTETHKARRFPQSHVRPCEPETNPSEEGSESATDQAWAGRRAQGSRGVPGTVSHV